MLLFACSDYLNMTPEKDIDTIETIFEQRTSADSWLAGIYGLTTMLMANICDNVAYLGADELVTCNRLRNAAGGKGKYEYPGFKISDGLQMSQAPYDNLWEEGGINNYYSSFYELIRSCNIFIENIDNVYNMLTSEKRQWKAEVKALKAFIYFELVRRYGPIVLVPDNIGVDEDMSKMQQPRVHVDTCFNTIVRLLDEAVPFLPTTTTRTSDRAPYFCQESALALKARVLVYAASPLFNGNEYYSDFKGKNGEPLFSTQKDPEKWKRAAEAADEAIRVSEQVGHHLYDGTNSKESDLLNRMGDIEFSMYSTFSNPEFLLEWKYTSEGFYKFCLPRFKSSDLTYFNEKLYGCLSPSMKMVEMYYTEHGLPIDADNTWNYNSRYQMSKEASSLYKNVVPPNTEVLQLHLRREPRFYACIAADRLHWQLGTNTPRDDYNLIVKAYKGEQFGSQYDIVTSNSWQNINGYWLKKHSYSTWATRTYQGNLTREETLPIIRLAELYLIQAEAWNEYLEKPDNRVYAPLNKVRKRAGIPDVLTAWKSYSKNPDKVDSREGMREIIRQEINIELAFEGHRYWNLRRWKIAHEKLNEKQYGWNVLGETARGFYNNFEGPVVIWNKCKFTAPRDYLNPIRAEQVLISGVVQNPGW